MGVFVLLEFFFFFFFGSSTPTNHGLLVILANLILLTNGSSESLQGISILTQTDKHTHVYKMVTNTHIPPMGALMSTAALELDPNRLYQSSVGAQLTSSSPLQSVAVFVYLSGFSNSQQGRAPAHFRSP